MVTTANYLAAISNPNPAQFPLLWLSQPNLRRKKTRKGCDLHICWKANVFLFLLSTEYVWTITTFNFDLFNTAVPLRLNQTKVIHNANKGVKAKSDDGVRMTVKDLILTAYSCGSLHTYHLSCE